MVTQPNEGSVGKPADKLRLSEILVIISPLIAVLAISTYGLMAPLRDMSVFTWDLVRAPILFFCLLCLFWRRIRWAMLGVIAAIVILTFGYMKGQTERHSAVRAYLESCYEQIAQRGKPFPMSLPPELLDGAHAVRWYYQWNGDDSFGIAYVIGSDGYVLQYPHKTWKFIGYRPLKYDPGEIFESIKAD